MPVTTFSSLESILEVTTVSYVVGYDNVLTNGIIALCRSYHDRTPVNRIRFWLAGSGDYKLKINLVDGRIWLQDIRFISLTDVNPTIHHDTAMDPYRWTYEEIAQHNQLRQQLIVARSRENVTDWDWKPL
jgi:hypothetical protein